MDEAAALREEIDSIEERRKELLSERESKLQGLAEALNERFGGDASHVEGVESIEFEVWHDAESVWAGVKAVVSAELSMKDFGDIENCLRYEEALRERLEMNGFKELEERYGFDTVVNI